MIRVIFVILVASLISCGDEKTKKAKGGSPTPPKKKSSYCELTNTIVNCYQDSESTGQTQTENFKKSTTCLQLQGYLFNHLADAKTLDTENWTKIETKLRNPLDEIKKCVLGDLSEVEVEQQAKALEENAKCFQKAFLSLQKVLCSL